MREEDETLGFSDAMSTQGTATPNPNAIDESVIDQDDELPNDEVSSETGHSIPEIEIPDTGETPQPAPAIPQKEETDFNPLDERDNAGGNSDIELERELNQLFLGGKADKPIMADEGKPKMGAAKAKRQKRAEKQAALEAEGKAPPKSRTNRKQYDPSSAIQKARGETVTTGKKTKKK
jgi:hypothetical protein